ncbi:DNA ligase [Pandoraea morbifera]|uniref:DNA ligase n=1 Tax=Pandoraea morbifera TaxID=2508300 RepID=A0A5E4YR03_9BURK|nr:BRCT domain-containing protein [Pandoraea morbifera]VVE51211.1 DNA ligase [Pandoraea morbifera]
MSAVDSQGQPLNLAFRSQAVAERKIDELIGIVKGVIADGEISHSEAEFVLKWLDSNRDVATQWPANVLYPRLEQALSDGFLDSSEEGELLRLMLSTVGGNSSQNAGESSNSTSLPVTNPPPEIEFQGRTFCFTGKFYSGTRDWCHTQVSARGGLPTDGITKKLNYLVIGEIGSRDWLHSTYGTKIKKAVEYATSGVPIVIVTEQHWADHI